MTTLDIVNIRDALLRDHQRACEYYDEVQKKARSLTEVVDKENIREASKMMEISWRNLGVFEAHEWK